MKKESNIVFRCDECSRSVTNRKHIRILMGWTSGWMIPPFTGGVPERSLSDRPEKHFCRVECFASFYTKALYEQDTRAVKVPTVESLLADAVLAEAGIGRSSVSGEDYVGARSVVRRETSAGGVGDSVPVRMGALGRFLSGYWWTQQADKRVDSPQPNVAGGRGEVPASGLEAAQKIS